MLWKKVNVLMGLAFLLLTPASKAYADDTEDLLNVYGLSLGKPIRTDIEERVTELEVLLEDMQTTAEVQQQLNSEYNAAMQKYIEKREELIDEILVDVDVYQKNNNEISSTIKTNLLDGDINELLKLDSIYKTNTVYINNLLSSMNNYKLDYTYRYITVDTSDIEAQLQQQKTLYVESLDTFKLGDVKGINWVLDNTRYITSKYGYRIDPIDNTNVKFHAGTDYRAPIGTEVHCLFNGEVIDCGWSNTIGYYITVQSGDNIKFLICHLSDILVEKGQLVNQYDVIALTGATGTRCTGPHLHLALYINGVAYDVDKLFR